MLDDGLAMVGSVRPTGVATTMGVNRVVSGPRRHVCAPCPAPEGTVPDVAKGTFIDTDLHTLRAL